MRVTPPLERRLNAGLPLLVALLVASRVTRADQSGGAAAAIPNGGANVAATHANPTAAHTASSTASSTTSSTTSSADEEAEADRPVERPGSNEAPDRAKRTDEGLPIPTDPLELERRQREAWRTSRPDSELPARAQVLALTVAGGVSLGSFEAGQLNLLAEALRTTPDSARLMIATGASAGSANALIAATSACRSQAIDAETSLGYRVWVPVGLEQLYVPERVTANSLFVVDGLKRGIDTITHDWSSGLPPSCDFVVSVAATRSLGIDVELTEGLEVPRQSERFVFHVQGRDQLVPLLENYVDPKRNFERPLLPFSGGSDLTGASDFRALADAAIASAAFPVAFPAHVVPHCITPRGSQFKDSPDQPPRCETPTRRDSFVDGGVFDNNPLGISYQIARNGLTTTGDRATFRPVPSGPIGTRPEIVYGYVDPDLTRYPQYQPQVAKKRNDPLLSVLMSFSDQALNAARGQELSALAERNPVSLRRLWLIQTGYPPVSSLLGAFFGFFERDFRDFDFYLGEYDSYYELRQHTGTILGVEPFVKALHDTLQGPAASVPQRHRKLGCLLSQFEPETHAHLLPLCSGDDMRNFRVLAQVTLDRLWSNCRRVQLEPNQRANHLQCTAAHDGAAPPRVDPSFRVRGERYQTDDEDDFDY
ncbi:MAG TPA: patatin-like phospholipase family protein, partial [Polyangiaceae bacterium]|nr:patatin-like phospholipase family protein [Polyangiaceae bacterium]